MALPFEPHGQLEQGGEGLSHSIGTLLDQLFQQRGDDRILVTLHPVFLFGDRQPE
jgi:hypothetical protein